MTDIPVEVVADAVGPGLGQGVRQGSATILPIAVPGVERAVVRLVRDDRLDHPLQAYVGQWPDGQVRVLSDDQAAWADLIAAVGAHIESAATALGYVRQFLEITRGPAVLVREVGAADELPWRPGSADEERRRADFLAGPPLPAPVAERTGGGFHVELTLLVGQRVQRNLFDVTPDGGIDATFRVLADDLPLPIVR
ncbi:hypothetical protein [Nakamurella sp.]|uniref:hypothetical protein n=1 Tax=Nakamurella sp. TaxID=1869182 RepID=UPI0037844720